MSLSSSEDHAAFGFEIWYRVNEALQGIADAFDRGDLELALVWFHKNVEWFHSPTHIVRGHQDVSALLQARIDQFARTSHNVLIPTLRAGPQDGLVESTAYFSAEHLMLDGSRYRLWGRYLDIYDVSGAKAMLLRRSVVVHVTEGTDRVYNMLPRKSP
jgi:hypothetical protein